MPLIYISPEEERSIIERVDRVNAWLLKQIEEDNIAKELETIKKREQELTQRQQQLLQEKQPSTPVVVVEA